jgi:hypothetical protein
MNKAILLLALIGCSTRAIAKEPPATTQAISNTRYAHRSISVSSSAEYSPDFNEVISFLERKAAEMGPTMLNLPAEKMDPPNFVVTTGVDGRGKMMLDLKVNAQDEPSLRPAAKEFLNAMVSSLETYIRDDFQNRKERAIHLARREQDVSSAQLDDATAQTQALRAKLRELAGRADVSTQGVTAAVSRLEEEKEKLELDLLGKKARREALEKEIAGQADRLQKQAQTDPVVAELKKVVEAREAKLKQVRQQYDSGAASQREVNDSVVEVAEARAKLAERERGGGNGEGGGGQILEALNRERITLSVDLQELEARLKLVETRLPGLRSAMDQLDALQRAEGDLKNARDALAASTNHLRDMSRRLESADPPQVLITQTEDREVAPVAN